MIRLNITIRDSDVTTSSSETTTTVTDTEGSTYDDENRLLSTDGDTYDYDNNGNLIEGDTDYRYLSTFLNGEKVNWLATIGNPSVTLSDVYSYGYSLDGRRTGKANYTTKIRYLYV
ncbi:MAG: hypothetical protein R6U61_08425 [Thermoplasmata archaeon]